MASSSPKTTSMTARNFAPSPPAGPNPKRARPRDSDDFEDEMIERNPRDWPFPTFTPSPAQTARAQRQAADDIRNVSKGIRPVVALSRPEIHRDRPAWNPSVTSRRARYDALDHQSRKDDPPKPTPPLQQPKWVTHIARVVKGCPQLGLGVVREPDRSRRTPTKVRRLRRRNPQLGPVDYIAEATKPVNLTELSKQLPSSARLQDEIPQDVAVEALRDKGVVECIRAAVERDAPKTQATQSVLVALPKLGVRLFTVSTRGRPDELDGGGAGSGIHVRQDASVRSSGRAAAFGQQPTSPPIRGRAPSLLHSPASVTLPGIAAANR